MGMFPLYKNLVIYGCLERKDILDYSEIREVFLLSFHNQISGFMLDRIGKQNTKYLQIHNTKLVIYKIFPKEHSIFYA